MHCDGVRACAFIEQCVVQILVAVALIQTRVLKTEEKKGSM